VKGPDHERWEDSAGAYLLGALPDDERAGFEAHLAGCDDCRAEVESLQVAVDALPMSAPQIAPPAALKDRIMVDVRRDAELLAAAGPAADRAPAVAPRRRRWRLALPAPLTAALAAGTLAVGIVIGGLAFGGGGGERTVTASVDRTQAPKASAKLEVQDGRAVLVAQGLPPAPGRRVYQVWLQRPSGAVVPTNALFTPRTDGSATATVGGVDNVKQVMVSAEPPGGSQQPTSKPILAARLS